MRIGMENDMEIFREERLHLIMQELAEKGKVRVSELAKQFRVSQSSIRLDLAELEQNGLLARTYGGAMMPESDRSHVLLSKNRLLERSEILVAEKEAIASAALTLVKNGDSLILDGGSTLIFFVRALRNRSGLTIVTNAVNLLPDLFQQSSHTVYACGGKAIPGYEILTGELALEGLSRFHTDFCFLGADGFSLKQGLSAADFSVAAVKKAMISAARRTVVLCDSTKIEQICLAPVAGLDKIDTLVTDDHAPASFLDTLRQRGLNVITASPTQLTAQ